MPQKNKRTDKDVIKDFLKNATPGEAVDYLWALLDVDGRDSLTREVHARVVILGEKPQKSGDVE